MSRYARETDANQAAIVAELRAIGATVLLTHRAGWSSPDLIVGYRGQTVLVEVKSVTGRESPGQVRARLVWKGGPWLVVQSAAEVLTALGVEVLP